MKVYSQLYMLLFEPLRYSESFISAFLSSYLIQIFDNSKEPLEDYKNDILPQNEPIIHNLLHKGMNDHSLIDPGNILYET